MSAPALRLEVAGGVAVVTLDRPDAMNALNLQLKGELADAVAELAGRDDVRAVVLTGAGRAFCAGGDIAEMDPSRPASATRARMHKLLGETVLPLQRLEKPVVAAVNGHCHGLGLSLALSCDIVYASDAAVFSLAFTKMGLVPDGVAIHYLPRIVGLQRARELVLTARRFGADEALALGVVTRVLPADELLPAARELAQTLASRPTLALGAAKRLLDQAPLLALDDAATLEEYAQAVMMASADHAEAVSAFLEKRTPAFRGA